MNKVVSYDNVKDSKVLWLGTVPDHWEVVPHRAIFDEVKDVNKPKATMLSVTIKRGIIPQSDLLMNSRKKDSSRVDKSKYKFVKIGDLAYNKMRAWQGALGISKYEGIVSPAYVIQRPHNQKVIAKYYHYLMRTPSFHKEAERWSYGITSDMWSLRPEHFKMIYTLLPPPDEQAAIVKYLDHATARLDRAIAAKRRVVKLLDEQKQAIIHRAVTLGLDESATLKDSGVPWLGMVPEDWDIRRLKQVSKISRGKFSHRPRNDPRFYDGNYPFIQTGSVARAEKYIQSYKQSLNDLGLSVSKRFPENTLVMTIAANIGDVAILNFEACFPDSLVGILPDSEMDLEFLFYMLRSMKEVFELEAPTNTQGNLSNERLGDIRISKPDLETQRAIVIHIENENSQLSKTQQVLKKEISLLEEFRTALISEVVTGKRDVRALAAALPDMQSQDEILFDDDDGLGDDLMEEALA